jgi:hypothetical protein
MHRASLVLCLLMLVGVPAAATEFRSGDIVSVDAHEVIDDDLFIAGNSIKVAGEVTGDIFAAGQAVRLIGPVGGSVMVAGQDVRVIGDVTGSVRAAGQSVTLGGDAGRNAIAVAQTLLLADTAHVARDLHAAANLIELEGDVGRDATVFGATAAVQGEVGRHLHFDGDEVTLGSSALVGGDFFHRAPAVAEITEGAVVMGQSRELPRRERAAAPRHVWRGPDPWLVLRIGAMLYLPAVLLFGIVGIAAGPRFFVGAAGAVGSRPWWSLLLGFLVLALGPTAVFLVMITVVGFPIGLLALVGWMTALLFSGIPVAIFLGRYVVSPARAPAVSPYLGLLVGMVILAALSWIPVIGFFTSALTVLLGVGAYARAAKGVAVEMRQYPA